MILGQMDGYHGDEFECNNDCGNCEICEEFYSQKWEEKFEEYRD